MRFGSVCSGIEAASVAWKKLGWQAAWLSEIEKHPSELLAQRYPETKNLGDMRFIAEKIRRGSIEAPEILVGGTPCQAFSIAGLRNSLDDSRGQLTLKFVELTNAIDEARSAIRLGAAIVVWENVPGVLSSKDNAFGCFLAGLAGEDEPLQPPGQKWSDAGCVLGPQRAVAWRCLDAQYFGLAQRRKRVFVIASARAGFDPTKVLFEFDGVRRDSPPSRDAAEVVAATIDASAGRRRGSGMNANQLVPTETFVVHGTQDPCVSGSTAFALGRNNGAENSILCFAENGRNEIRLEGGVRRLTPSECEALQGFPRGYTAITVNGKIAADSPRYKALGNSMAVNCMHWIGKRISQHINNKGEN